MHNQVMDTTIPRSSMALRHKYRRASEGPEISSANSWFLRRRKVCSTYVTR